MRTHVIIRISLRRHLGLRLLLWHSVDAWNTHIMKVHIAKYIISWDGPSYLQASKSIRGPLATLKLTSYPSKNWKNIREPPDYTGNEPRFYIHVVGSRQDSKIQKDKCMLMSMETMCYVYQLSTELEGKNIQIVPKSTPRDTNQSSATV